MCFTSSPVKLVFNCDTRCWVAELGWIIYLSPGAWSTVYICIMVLSLSILLGCVLRVVYLPDFLVHRLGRMAVIDV